MSQLKLAPVPTKVLGGGMKSIFKLIVPTAQASILMVFMLKFFSNSSNLTYY